MNLAKMMGTVLVCSLAVLSPSLSSAAHLTILDDASGLQVVPDANFEFGFGSVQNNQHDWSFNGSWLSLAGTASGSGIIYFVKPGTNTLADIYEVSWTWSGSVATISGRFESDANGVLLSGRTIPAGFPTVESTNGNVDPLPLFRDPNTGDPVTIPSHLSMLVTFEYSPIATESATWSAIKTQLAQ